MSDVMRKAVYSDIPRLSKIWQTSFGDDKEYVDSFLSRRFDSAQTLVFEKDGNIISQLFLLPVSIASLDGYYLYAAATDKDYRGRKVMASLLQYAEKTAKQNGKDFIFLVPGTQSLYSYYKKHGYEETFSKNIGSLSRNELKETSEVTVFSTSTEDAVEFLKNYKDNTVLWNNESLLYAVKEFITYRGNVYTAKDKALLMLSKHEAVIICKEADFSLGVSMLFKVSDGEDFEITTPVPFGKKEKGGMVLKLTESAKSVSFDNVFVLFAKE